MNTLPEPLREDAAAIQLLILDVDGVLTDGTLTYGADGEVLKHFNVKDGLGIRLLIDHGIQVAVITARDSAPLHRRMQDLGIEYFYPGCPDKLEAYAKLCKSLGLRDQQVAYVGDDVLDLPVMHKVRLPVAVADAHPLVQDAARHVTHAAGGMGAVRELADGLLSTRGDLKVLCDRYLARKHGSGKLETA